MSARGDLSRHSANDPGSVIDPALLHVPGVSQASRSEPGRDGQWRHVIDNSWPAHDLTIRCAARDGRRGLAVSILRNGQTQTWPQTGRVTRIMSVAAARDLIAEIDRRLDVANG